MNLHSRIVLRDRLKVSSDESDGLHVDVEQGAGNVSDGEVGDGGVGDLCAGAHEERIA
jgi:hypothetical protein